jgi:hypothetical protein
VRDDASERSLRTRLGKALAEQRDRRFGDLFIRNAGFDKHTKGGLWRLEEAVDAEDAATWTPSSAHLPQENDLVSDSFAEDAELAEDDPAPSHNKQGDVSNRSFAGEGTDQHPQHPHLPQTGSKPASEPADVVRKTGQSADDLGRCKRCGEPLAGGSSNLCVECRHDVLRKVMEGQQ